MKIHESTKMALNAMLVFLISGSILVLIETINTIQNIRKQTIIHTTILAIFVCIFEELPLAGLRWNLKTSANYKSAGGLGYVTGIFSIIAPLMRPILKCVPNGDGTSCCVFKCLSNEDGTSCSVLKSLSNGDETGCCCDDSKSLCDDWYTKHKTRCLSFLFLLAIGIIIINVLNWLAFEAPGAELCVRK